MEARAAGPRRRAARGPAGNRELLGFRQVFETWWIAVPVGFDECWVAEGGYWHAWDRRRSVSMSSTILTDRATGRDVPAAELMDRFAEVIVGEPIEAAPDGLLARAAVFWTDPGSRAERALAGIVVVDGRVLITTITSDDLDWAVRTWRSIGYRAAPVAAQGRAGGRLDG